MSCHQDHDCPGCQGHAPGLVCSACPQCPPGWVWSAQNRQWVALEPRRKAWRNPRGGWRWALVYLDGCGEAPSALAAMQAADEAATRRVDDLRRLWGGTS